MRIIKADIVSHLSEKGSKHSIYSLDFQPNGTRLATGGGDCSVKIWDVISLLNTPDIAKDALLATLTMHTKSVNTLRWSPDGQMLASGSDDTYIIIYKYTPGKMQTKAFGSKPSNNKEAWSRCFTLQGHSMDILDLNWSPRGLLASASIDNTVMIWNPCPPSKGGPVSVVLSPLKTLYAHQSFVRGVSFDATGKYLASSGADNVIILWDSDNNFKEVRKIKQPLKDSPDRSLFRRMDWAPDGLSLCITASLKSGKPIGNVIKRKSWEIAADLVGHTAATSTCRFFPQMLNRNVLQSIHNIPEPVSKEVESKIADHNDEIVTIDNEGSSKDAEAPSEVNTQSSLESQPRRKSLRLSGVRILSDSSSSSSDDSESESLTGGSSTSSEASDANEKIGFKLQSSKLSCTIAIGDQVGVISLWGSHSNRALLVLRDIVEGPVTDISWANSYSKTSPLYTKTIFACSGLDGTVVIVDLEGEVLGEVVSKDSDRFEDHIKSLYGRSYHQIIHESVTAPITQDEGSHNLPNITQKRSVNPSSSLSQRLSQPSSSSSSSFVNPLKNTSSSTENVIALQLQSKTKDGKKRIQPLLLQDNGTIDAAYYDEMVNTAAHSQHFSDSTNKRPRISPVLDFPSQSLPPPPQYFLKVFITRDKYVMTIPRPLKNSKKSNILLKNASIGPNEIEMKLEIGDNTTTLSCGEVDISVPKWTTSIPFEVTCTANSCSHKIGHIGLFGGTSGGMSAVALSTGTSLSFGSSRVLILGAAVSFLDIQPATNSDCENFRVLAMTVDGKIWVWNVEIVSSESLRFTCIITTNCDSVIKSLSSLSTQNINQGPSTKEGSSSKSIVVNNCNLSESGDVRISAGIDKTMQLFEYSPSMSVWVVC